MSEAKFDMTERLPTWRRGQVVSQQEVANQINGAAKLLNRIGSGIAPPTEIAFEPEPTATKLLRVRVGGVGGNTLTTERDDRPDVFTIAKPLLMQTQNYAGKTRSFLNVNGQAVDVVYPEGEARPTKRVAQVTDVGPNGEPRTRSFVEAITMPYAPGDFLIAERVGDGITGIEGVAWMDRNNDGRTWAEGASSDADS